MDTHEELIEIQTIQIALDDKIHKMLFDLQKIRNIHKSLDERLAKIKEKLNAHKTS